MIQIPNNVAQSIDANPIASNHGIVFPSFVSVFINRNSQVSQSLEHRAMYRADLRGRLVLSRAMVG